MKHYRNGIGKREFSELSSWNLGLLCDYITGTHHTYIRQYLPRIIKDTISLLASSSERESERQLLADALSDFEAHMNKEEKLLFPFVKHLVKLDEDNGNYETPPFGSVEKPVEVLCREHENKGRIFAMIRSEIRKNISAQKHQPKVRDLFTLLDEFESNLKLHIEIENKILFPKAIQLEKKLRRKIKPNQTK